MAHTPLPSSLLEAALGAHLGAYVGPLTPGRASSRRGAVVSALALTGVVVLWRLAHPQAWWSVTGLVVAGLVALAALVMALVELTPGPGEVHLFEEGLLQVTRDGDLVTLPYAASAGPAPEGRRQQETPQEALRLLRRSA